ncbi:MAG: response regulator transcription factor [Bacilli bacterium]
MTSRKKIIIVEDQIILNDMLKKIISNNYDVVATSDDASNLIALCEKYNPDIVLTDICTKNNSNGIINGKKIKDKYVNKIKVLAITGVPDITFLNQAKKSNLDGLIYKNLSSDLLLANIEQVLNGYKLFPDNVTYNNEAECLKKLTNKEFEILKLLCNGNSRNEIANKLNISNGTLKNHISSILNKTEFENISKLLVFCISNNYIVPNI